MNWRRPPLRLFAMLGLVALALSGCQFQRPEYVKLISPGDLNSLMRQKAVFLVDVHTPEQHHIKGTRLFIPYDNVEQFKDRLPEDKNTPIYVYCRHGPMANAAARTLHKLGYRDITNLEGGTIAWDDQGLPFE